MKIGVPKEVTNTEKRVALTPEIVQKLCALGHTVFVEHGAGEGAQYLDSQFTEAGAHLVKDIQTLYKEAELIVRVSPVEDMKKLPDKGILVGLLRPNNENVKAFSRKKITSLALEMIPRISRAQPLDVLSSQSNLAGYRAVIEAANEYGHAMPLMMTAAGTIPPARVLILGAGVAGLQAIATARRLGAVVSAYDVRSAVKEEVESLGATFIEVQSSEAGEGGGGYAKEMSADYKKLQQEKLLSTLKTQNIVITTALIPGKPAPLLVTEDMVRSMKPGSIIVDMATETGGNCALSEKDKVVQKYGVKIIGYSNIPSRIAADASRVYARNLFYFLEILLKDNGLNLQDEIIQAALLTKGGDILHSRFKGDA